MTAHPPRFAHAPGGGIRRAGTDTHYTKAQCRDAGRKWTPRDAEAVAGLLKLAIENAFDAPALDRVLFDNNRVICALEAFPDIYAALKDLARARRAYLTGTDAPAHS